MMKIVVSDPKTGKAYQVETDDAKARNIYTKRIGDKIDGEVAGLPGFELEITGGTDKDGFAMRFDISGQQRKRILASGGAGHKPKEDGERRRKLVRGDTVAADIAQLNVKVVKVGSKPLEEILKPATVESEAPIEDEKKEEKAEPPKEETPKGEKAEEKPEPPKEEKKE